MFETVGFEGVAKALVTIIAVSVLIERGLSAVYATTAWIVFRKHMKIELKLYMAIAVNIGICYATGLDAFAIMTGTQPTAVGLIVTALANSGGARGWNTYFKALESVRVVEESQSTTTTSAATSTKTTIPINTID